jgi:hypothetical protein
MTQHVKTYLKTKECLTDVIWLCHRKKTRNCLRGDKRALAVNETNENYHNVELNKNLQNFMWNRLYAKKA